MVRLQQRGAGLVVPETARIGLGRLFGSWIAAMLFVAFGAIIFIPGFYMVNIENAKKRDADRNYASKTLGYVLMFVGIVTGLGFGISVFFGAVVIDGFTTDAV